MSRSPQPGPAGTPDGAPTDWHDAARAAESALRASEERLRLAQEAAGLGIHDYDIATGTITWDRIVRTLWGFDADEPVTYARFLEGVHPDDRAAVESAVARAVDVAGSGVYDAQYRVTSRADGRTRWVAATGRVTFAAGRAVRMVGTVQDVTSRVRAERAAQRAAARSRFRAALAEALRPLADPAAVQREASRVLGRHLGASRVLYAEVTGDGTHAVVHADYHDGVPSVAGTHRLEDHGRELIAAFRAGRTLAVDDVASDPRLDDAERAATRALGVRAHAFVPLIKAGRPVALLAVHDERARRWTPGEIGLIEDTAERTWSAVEHARAAAALRESERRFRQVFRHAGTGIALKDSAGRIQRCNPAYCAMLGYTEDELLGTDYARLVHPDDRAANAECVEQLRSGAPGQVEIESRYIRRDGVTVWVNKLVTLVTDDADAPASVLALVTDVTERRRAEEQLRRHHDTFAHLIRNNPFGVYVVDADFRLRHVSQGAERAFRDVRPLLGRAFDEVIRAIWPDPFATEALARFRDTLATGEPYESPGTVERRRDVPDVEAYDWRIERITMPDGRYGVVCYFYDLSERVRLEQALRASERRFRELADAMPQLVWTAGADGAVTYYNSRCALYGGIERADDGRWMWQPIVHPDDLDATLRAWNAAVAAGTTYQTEHRVRMADGSFRWHLSRAHPVPGPEGVQWFGTATDIDSQKQAESELRLHRENLQRLVDQRTVELAESHERLRLTERLSAIGTLAAGLGHDLGNILVPMRAWLEELEGAELPDEPGRHVQSLRRSAEYLRSLAAGLRALALDPERADQGPRRTTLEDWWRDADAIYRAPLPRRVSMRVGAFRGLPPVAISVHALTQAVFNIIQNAGDALRDHGHGTITIDAARHGDTVHLAIRDDGPGMSPEVRRRCMEPFFTTRARARGTGLGLSIVHNLLERSGAAVEVESEPGAGTVFTLRLPVAGVPETRNATAALTIGDLRQRAVVRGLLAGLGMTAPDHPMCPAPDAALWIVDASVGDEELDRFDARPGGPRRVVRLDAAPTGAPPRSNVDVVEIRPSAIRAALRRAVEALSPAGCA